MTKKLTLILGLLMLTSLLSACAGVFQPKHKTIEYDEQVKLHDGSMIWVHIKRHYVLEGGGALGDSGAFEMSYHPQEVEISWDTGFKGVGRKSVYFRETIYVIDKFNGSWYVNGAAAKSAPSQLNNSINCWNIGIPIRDSGCMVGINSKGDYFKPESKTLANFNTVNILRPVQIKDWGDVPTPLKGKKISWLEKNRLESLQNQEFNILGNKLTVE